jgi:hypothetical protein
VDAYAYVLFSLHMFWIGIYSLCFALGLVHGWELKVEIYRTLSVSISSIAGFIFPAIHPRSCQSSQIYRVLQNLCTDSLEKLFSRPLGLPIMILTSHAAVLSNGILWIGPIGLRSKKVVPRYYKPNTAKTPYFTRTILRLLNLCPVMQQPSCIQLILMELQIELD